MVNWKRLNELRAEIGDDDFQEVVQLFLEEVEVGISGLCPTAPITVLKQQAHFLKGSALNLGFNNLAMLCNEIETANPRHVFDGRALRQIAAAYHEEKSELLSSAGSESRQ